MDVFEICGIIDEVDHVDYEYEVKTGTGSSFRHFGENQFSRFFAVAMGRTRPILGIISYVVEINIQRKFQGHSSRASYIR